MVREIKQCYVIVFILLIASLNIVGCKQPPASESLPEKNITRGNEQKGYLNSDSNGAMFIRWTELNNKLNGQLNIFFAKGNRGKSTATSSHSFDGVSDGKNISLNFTGNSLIDPLGGKTWTGTIGGDGLTLIIPVKNGMLEPVIFKASSVEEYNHLVAGIHQDVSDENAKVKKEDQEVAIIRSEKNAVIEASKLVENSLRKLASSIDRLQNTSQFEDVLESYSNTWAKMNSDNENLKEKAAEKPLTAYKLGTVQYVLGTLSYDLGTFQHHSGTLNFKLDSTKDAINTVKENSLTLSKSWDFLQKSTVANTSGQPVPQYSESVINQTLNLADAAIDKSQKAMQKAMAQRTLYEDQAKALYKKAESFVKSLKPVNE